MKFTSPQVNLYIDNLDISKQFYEKLGFSLTFTAEMEGKAVHHELDLEGFKLGVATKESTEAIHGLIPGSNSGCELVFWTEDTDAAIEKLIHEGATRLSDPHDFLNGKLRAGWVRDPDGNPIQIVCKKS
ncbi:MAG TPA: VOC family protein [Bacillales bacterium]|nr:VOC family protein [Bacillales bacterium]